MTLRGILASLSSRFARVTSSVSYIPQIDGLRAVAMLLVLFHHVAAFYLEQSHRLGTQHLPDDWNTIALRSPLVGWFLHLWIGVPIFCAISGFVLSIPYARTYFKGNKPPSVWIYLLRRLIRMEPPYVVSMTILLFMILMPWRMGWHYAFGMLRVYGAHYLASLVYLHAQIYGTPSWINGMAWTLEVELQFYLMLPLLAHIYRIPSAALRRGILMTLITIAGCISIYLLPALQSPRLSLSILVQLQFFLAGMLLADLQLDVPKPLRLGSNLADAVACVSIASMIYVLHWAPQLALLEPFLIALLLFSVFRAKLLGALLSSPWFTVPGTMCYTIYLYHGFIMMRLMPFTLRLFPPVHALLLDVFVQFLLLIGPVLVIAGALYMLAERPFVVMSHEIASRFRTARKPITAVRLETQL